MEAAGRRSADDGGGSDQLPPRRRGKQAKWQPRSADEMKRLSDLAQSAIGFDAVARRSGQRGRDWPLTTNGGCRRSRSWGASCWCMAGSVAFADSLWNHSDGIAGVLLLCRAARAAFAGQPRQRGANRPQTLQRRRSRLAADARARELTPEHQAAEQRKLHAQNVFEQVSEQVKRDPAQSTRLLESWIRSE